MTRKLPKIAMLGTMAATLSAGWAVAQPRLDQTQLAEGPPPVGDVRMVDGKVVDLERRPQMVTRLVLDNGTAVALLAVWVALLQRSASRLRGRLRRVLPRPDGA